MTTARSVNELILENEYNLAKYKAVQAAFPNAKVNYFMDFSDKMVNQKYTKFSFRRAYNGLYVLPYCEVPFRYNGIDEENIIVHSSPKANKLVHLAWNTYPGSKRKIMKFARIHINMKNNNFKDEMLNSCKAEIMSFIKDNPGYHLDTKHLDSRLKKLICFT